MPDLLIFSIYLITYYILHSMLAGPWFKKHIQKNWIPYRFYRVFYNLLAIISLIPLFYLYFNSTKTSLFESSQLVKLIGSILIVLSLGLWYVAFRSYYLGEFLGTDRLLSKQKTENVLNVSGLNKWVRHPLYSVAYVIIPGFILVFPNDHMLVFGLITAIYIPLGSTMEEKRLVQEFGEKYLEYQKRTPMLFPSFSFLFNKRNDKLKNKV